jgi:hypothetical protein
MEVFEIKNSNPSYSLNQNHSFIKGTGESAMMSRYFYRVSGFIRSINCFFVAQIRQLYSHYGKLNLIQKKAKRLSYSTYFQMFCDGILSAIYGIPVIKRKTAMKNFEDEVNYSLLQKYLYVSYLDTLVRLNQLDLKNQKNAYLAELCKKPDYSNNLCLNMIMGTELIATPKTEL